MPNVNNQKIKIALVGGGVSSVAAALTFPTSFQVDIYERDERLLRKLLKTGNGKANIFNLKIDQTMYNNPELIAAHPALLQVVKDFYHDKGVLTFTDEEGRGYPYSRSARSLANHLLSLLGSNIKVFLNKAINHIDVDGAKVMIEGQSYDDVLIVTGSSAYDPSVNTDNNNTQLFADLGVKLSGFYPVSGPIMIKENLRMIENEKVKATLSICALDRVITSESGEILFKKDNLSGIASFIANSRLVWDYRQHGYQNYTVSLNLIDGYEKEVEALLDKKNISTSAFQGLVSDPLAAYLTSRCDKNIDSAGVMRLLTDLKFKISKDFILSHDKGQLMSGGVDIGEINPHTFALKSNSNIYVGGEVLDIDGVSGGYNLMFALYSGITIAKDIVNKHCQ
ncbi:MAG TPA: NAD(P)/FAD-dependent oxidoreductase [Bacilli bacterium]|nr:NAD(P)/FAD-dependent oxidoreductase [Bacilli bacterium]